MLVLDKVVVVHAAGSTVFGDRCPTRSRGNINESRARFARVLLTGLRYIIESKRILCKRLTRLSYDIEGLAHRCMIQPSHSFSDQSPYENLRR